MVGVPKHYIPEQLNKKDKKHQKQELKKSRKLYKQGKYYTRKHFKSFKSKPTGHAANVRRIYKLNDNKPIKLNELIKKTHCSKKGLNKIIKKGMGAYYSSGSRPNQTAHSWGKARLYSAITGGPASKIDKIILENNCKKTSKALRLAKNPKAPTTRKKVQLGGYRMKERILKFEKSSRNGKKYQVIVEDLKTKKRRIIHFGASDYQQYKDRTPLKLYAHKNHYTRRRMRNYFNRHSGTPLRENAIELEKRKSKGYYNPKILSHEYLW